MAGNPKTASFVDDFRNEMLNEAMWTYTGTRPTVYPMDTASMVRGLQMPPGSSVVSVSPSLTDRYDFNDSEVVFIVGRWGSGTLTSFSLVQDDYRYTISYDDGVLTLTAVEAGVTRTENYTTMVGGVTTTVNNWKIRYLRIAHSATTGRVEFYGGLALDGSDQRSLTRALGTAAGVLTPPAAKINSMNITIARSAGSGSNLLVRAVNAPAGGLRRYPNNPGAYLIRDFSSWTSRMSGSFKSFVDTMSHEWKVLSVGLTNAITVTDSSLTQRALTIRGNGTTRTIIRSGIAVRIKDVSLEAKFIPVSLPNVGSNFGFMWRATNLAIARYQLHVTKTEAMVAAYYNSYNVLSATSSPRVPLISVPLETIEGVAYTWRVSHFDDRITVYRDDEEIMSFTELNNYVPDSGHIGFEAGDFSSGSADTVVKVEYVKAVPSYDERTFATGISFQNRGLGVYVKEGRRDGTKTFQSDDPAVVDRLEDELGTKFNTVFHYTAASNTVDAPLIAAATRYAQQGRTNVISWNSFSGNQLSAIISGSMNSVIDAWGAALNTIPGTVFVAPLPYPDLFTPWSPYSYDYTNTATTGTSTGMTKTGATWTTNQYQNGTARWIDQAGVMRWSKIASNTATALTFSTTQTGTAIPVSGTRFYLRAPSGAGTAAEYRAAFRYIHDRLAANGCRAGLVFGMNWNADPDVSGSAYTSAFSDVNPGDGYYDAYMIRAVNTGLTVDETAQNWRSVSRMLQGGAAPGDPLLPKTGVTPYYQMRSHSPSKPMFLLTGTAETHSLFNNFEHGYGGIGVTASNSGSETNDPFDSMFAGSGGSSQYFVPTDVTLYSKEDFSGQRALRFLIPTAGDSKYGEYVLPSAGVTRSSYNLYIRFDDLGAGAERAAVIDVRDSGNSVVTRVVVDGPTGVVTLQNAAGTTIGTLSTTVVEAVWYRLNLEMDTGTSGNHKLHLKMTAITSRFADKPDSYNSRVLVTGLTMNAPLRVRFGGTVTGATNNIRSGFEIESPKVSWDTTAETYSKAKWIEDMLSTRGFPQISKIIMFSSDQTDDTIIYSGNTTRFGSNMVDTRLTGSRYTKSKVIPLFTGADTAKVHTRPQLKEVGYEPTAAVGNVEYMYFKEEGHAPLYVVPRLGGILLRDFDLGSPSVRAAVEQRPSSDGTNDYTRHVGSKAVSLSFVTFDDPSGSAAFYNEVVSSWAHPRRRPLLVYKLKNTGERTIRLRPESNIGSWSTDGIRTGFKETQLQLVGIDGKDYSTEVNSVLIPADIQTPVNTPGTASTPPIIRIYGGSTGCLNPSIALVSEEAKTYGNTARVSFGTETANVYVAPGNFLEIDMDKRSAQLNGTAGYGNSYLRHMVDRQWFVLDPYYNNILLQTDDSNGYAEVIWRDAYL